MFANTTPGLNLKAGRQRRGPILQSTVQEGLVSFNYFQSFTLGREGPVRAIPPWCHQSLWEKRSPKTLRFLCKPPRMNQAPDVKEGQEDCQKKKKKKKAAFKTHLGGQFGAMSKA